MKKKFATAGEFLEDSWRLAAAVRRGGWRPDFLVALWRGGAFPGVAVHEFLKATGWDVPHAPLVCSSYAGIGESDGEVKFSFGEEVFSAVRKGWKVLVVDDVFDTGRTAAAVLGRFREAGAEPRLACVCEKPSRNATGGRPDYCARTLGGEWIVFPHETCGLDADELAEKSPVLAGLVAECAGDCTDGISGRNETKEEAR